MRQQAARGPLTRQQAIDFPSCIYLVLVIGHWANSNFMGRLLDVKFVLVKKNLLYTPPYNSIVYLALVG